ncbi:DUF3300 domain-containing protein [Pseudoxanthomonas suwonensis]|uniref:DUF3300 domain-containing protein n=1 Tax=Pseudoxanthomonas suwonensis TaxID=314722 RepID=A0A0E3UNM7_9GAMM|nr:DUF3300 domain-containing protein [Pseudoxanthomonas suwonensis]AKC87080.1 hypothetical protein WQ53_10310 [Pseudoxanthomonas suwonensis]
MRFRILFAASLILVAGCSRESTPASDGTAPPATSATPAASPQERLFGQEELDQMVAPIALYPDPLLAQVLMAATYPGEVADAAAWSKAHPDAQGDAAVRQVADQPWDASVQSLVAFPQALATLGQDPAWVQKLGDAFLAQPNDVMDAVQRLRGQAQAAGNLESNEYQKVTAQPVAAAPAPAPVPAGGTVAIEPAPQQAIIIEPAQPDVVYVPSYDPTTVYGTWAYPSYPPVYYPPPSAYYPVGTALASGIAFGVGLAITDAIWGDIGWHHWGRGDVDIDIDIDRYNNINVNRLDARDNTWRHDPAHRDGVPYRDQAHRDRHGRQLDGADRRAEFRGDDDARAQAREQARASMEKRGVEAPARTNTEARERAQQAGREQARERAQQVDRDQARERAQQVDRDQARERAQQVDRDQARERAQQVDRDQARERAQAATNREDRPRDAAQRAQQATPAQREQAREAVQNRPDAAQRIHQVQGNDQARAAARQQASQTRQASPHSNAFQGASHPSGSRAAAERGHASQATARQHAPASRPAGQQVSRPANPPRRGHR